MKLLPIIIGLLLVIPFLGAVSAIGGCQLQAILLNQDPYPAVPGSYVKLVFQVSGLDNPNCGRASFELLPQYPFSLDPDKNSTAFVRGVAGEDVNKQLLVPYDVRVDPNAIDGNNTIEARYKGGGTDDVYIFKDFDVKIEDVRADFELSVRDYDPVTNTITFDILNIGEHDVEAVTIDAPKQDTLMVKGANRNIIGSLDSNEDTSFSFEGTPSAGTIMLNIYYTDEINERRSLQKEVTFDPQYFEGRAGEQKGTPWYVWIIGLIIIVGIVWYIHRRSKKKKAK